MSDTTENFKKQLPKNALMAGLSFMAYTLSAVWLTPYLVNYLGAAAYGLIPIAGLFTQYVAIIAANLSGAVNRFLTVELQKPDGNPNAIFNSALALYLILILIQLPLFAVGLFYADKIFSIPPELKTDALLLLGCSAGGFLVSLLNGVFGVSLYSTNRLDISSAVNLIRLIIRLGLIFLLFSVFGPRLRYIGFIDLGLGILVLGCSVFFWKRMTPELKISGSAIRWRILQPVFKMSIWTIINQLGSLLYLRTDIWIINRFISPVIAGQYAAVLMISNFIRQLGLLFSGQFGPVGMSYWAKGELGQLQRVLKLAVKLLAIALAIPVALICSNGARILELWLGADFAHWALLLTVLCIHLPINTAVYPLFQLQVVGNRVKLPALITFSLGIVNVAVSYVLGVTCGMGALGVALATAIVLTLKNALFTPIYGAYIVKLPVLTFIKPMATGLLMLISVWITSQIFSNVRFGPGGKIWLGLAIRCGGIALIAGFAGWCFAVSKNEKQVLIRMLPGKLRPFAEKLC